LFLGNVDIQQQVALFIDSICITSDVLEDNKYLKARSNGCEVYDPKMWLPLNSIVRALGIKMIEMRLNKFVSIDLVQFVNVDLK
jgi:hypothetical protein